MPLGCTSEDLAMNTEVAIIQISSITVSPCSLEPELSSLAQSRWQADHRCYEALYAEAFLLQICSEFLFTASTCHTLHLKYPIWFHGCDNGISPRIRIGQHSP